MRKYLLGLLALTMVIAFSAFATKGFSSKAKAADEKSLLWYPVQSNGEIDHTALVNPDEETMYTKTELRGLSLIPCTETPGEDCLRGFEEPQTEDTAALGEDSTEKASD